METTTLIPSPLTLQYQRIRATLLPDVLLFFRLGDFYELFHDDAKTASPILNVTLTRRQDTPMCGVPFYAVEASIAKLIAAGKRVAICEQKGEVLPGKLVEREVTRIIDATGETVPSASVTTKKQPVKRKVAQAKEEKPEGLCVAEIVRKYNLPRGRIINAVVQGWLTPFFQNGRRLFHESDIQEAIKPQRAFNEIESKGTPGQPVGLEVCIRADLKTKKFVEPFATKAGAAQYQAMFEQQLAKQQSLPL